MKKYPDLNKLQLKAILSSFVEWAIRSSCLFNECWCKLESLKRPSTTFLFANTAARHPFIEKIPFNNSKVRSSSSAHTMLSVDYFDVVLHTIFVIFFFSFRFISKRICSFNSFCSVRYLFACVCPTMAFICKLSMFHLQRIHRTTLFIYLIRPISCWGFFFAERIYLL